MAVYVDELINNGWRLGHNCHLIADSIAELKEFAITHCKMRESWFQPRSTPHFDLVSSRRTLAVRAGAIELTRTDFVAKIRELRERRNNGEFC